MKNSRAFTLVETMVAIAILTIAIVAPFAAAQSALQASYVARDQLIAATLAQEGLEYVREVRDNNYLANPTSYDPFATMDLSPDCRAPKACVIDATQWTAGTEAFGTTQSVKQCSGSDCSALPLYVTSTGVYTQQTIGTKTHFVRSVTLTPNPGGAPNVMRATVTVSWTTNNKPYSMTVSEDFYAWL